MKSDPGARPQMRDQNDGDDDMNGGADPRISALIDRNLKLVYSDLAQEELPDRFKDLLAVLKAQDSSAGPSR